MPNITNTDFIIHNHYHQQQLHKIKQHKLIFIYTKPSYFDFQFPANSSFFNLKLYQDITQIIIMILQNTTQSKIIAVEGNLGAGKSTYLAFLQKILPEIQIIKEPVDQWQDIRGHNLLEMFYKDSRRWSFTFQTYAMVSRMRLWNATLKENPNTLKLSERSMLADRYVFGDLMGELGNVLPVEMQVYKDIADQVLISWPLQGIIYLKCSPQTCHQRIKRRNRFQQQSIPLDYLTKVDEKYCRMIECNSHMKVLVIDTEVYNVGEKEDQQKIKKLICDYISTFV